MLFHEAFLLSGFKHKMAMTGDTNMDSESLNPTNSGNQSEEEEVISKNDLREVRKFYEKTMKKSLMLKKEKEDK